MRSAGESGTCNRCLFLLHAAFYHNAETIQATEKPEGSVLKKNNIGAEHAKRRNATLCTRGYGYWEEEKTERKKKSRVQ
jgi:hypothetical protein